MSAYKAVIGLEVHIVLGVESKIFCGCPCGFGGGENTQICAGCIGMPGTLPLLNSKVLEYCVKAGLAMNCAINLCSRQDRKHYFYPDLPKGFQLSQLDLPVCKNGYVEIETEAGAKRIGVNRIHIEEDAGKLIHSMAGTRVDLNRGAAGLIEIVSEPDLASPEDVRAYLEALREILVFAGVSDCRMEEGSMRCDVNVSIHKEGEPFGVRTEMKNLNSLSAAKAAAAYEIRRQEDILEKGGALVQATLRWDDDKGANHIMRQKEFADEYYYFPEPDIPPVRIRPEDVEAWRKALPEMPAARRTRYRAQYGLSAYDAGVLTSTKTLSDLFDQAVASGAPAKTCANFIMGDVIRLLNEKGMRTDLSIGQVPIGGEALGELATLVSGGRISSSAASKVIELLFAPEQAGKSPTTIMDEHNLAQLSDHAAIADLCRQAIEANPKTVADYRVGRKQAISALVGQVMKASKGKANPGMVNQVLEQLLGE